MEKVHDNKKLFESDIYCNYWEQDADVEVDVKSRKRKVQFQRIQRN